METYNGNEIKYMGAFNNSDLKEVYFMHWDVFNQYEFVGLFGHVILNNHYIIAIFTNIKLK